MSKKVTFMVTLELEDDADVAEYEMILNDIDNLDPMGEGVISVKATQVEEDR